MKSFEWMQEPPSDLATPEPLSIDQIFNKDRYIVPIYQRHYAWENTEIEKLLDDIIENVKDDDEQSEYYLGSLVVNALGDGKYEVIDGQQRLTTLFLLLNYLNEPVPKDSLVFEAREKSNVIFSKIISNQRGEIDKEPDNSIEIGYKTIHAYIINKSYDKKSFAEKLKNTKLIRVEVPKCIDLNHYFEIMNTRGEQLELHEIAKAHIISAITDASKEDPIANKDAEIAAEIWDACARMDKYVQMNFKKDVREKMFDKDWEIFQPDGFDKLRECFSFTNDETNKTSDETEDAQEQEKAKLIDILNNDVKLKEVKPGSCDIEEAKRFESIIGFPDFLLQINQAMKFKDGQIAEEPGTNNNNYKLYDNKLLDNLEDHWSSGEKAREFIFNLLKYRYLFDKYIVKREYKVKAGDEKIEWSLAKLTAETYNNRKSYRCVDLGSNRLKTLQALLRITYTSPKTMDWIYILLADLDEENTDIIDNSIKVLEKYCRDKISNETLDKIDNNEIKGFGIERIVFTYLDYLLLREKDDGTGHVFEDYEVKFRNSIEHFYPQNPTLVAKKWDPENLNENLNMFGNLALLTVSDNSRFSNLPPVVKADETKIVNQSQKLKIMADIAKSPVGWTPVEAKKHGKDMIALLKDDLQNGTQNNSINTP